MSQRTREVFSWRSLRTCQRSMRPYWPDNRSCTCSHGICTHLVWDMTIANLSITWVIKNFKVMVTRFLKLWSGVSWNVVTHQLYLSKSSGGLHLPSISSIFKKTRCGLAASQMWKLSGLNQAPHCKQDSSWGNVPHGGLQTTPESSGGNEGWPWGLTQSDCEGLKQRVTATNDSRQLEVFRQLIYIAGQHISCWFDNQASSTPNLVQEELEGAALTFPCTFAAAWLHDSDVFCSFFSSFYIAILSDLAS